MADSIPKMLRMAIAVAFAVLSMSTDRIDHGGERRVQMFLVLQRDTPPVLRGFSVLTVLLTARR